MRAEIVACACAMRGGRDEEDGIIDEGGAREWKEGRKETKEGYEGPVECCEGYIRRMMVMTDELFLKTRRA